MKAPEQVIYANKVFVLFCFFFRKEIPDNYSGMMRISDRSEDNALATLMVFFRTEI
jgi:hypothetical protein